MAIRMAQYGTGHGHAAGKMQAMRGNRDVEVVGIFEPEAEYRAHFAAASAYQGVHWFDSAEQMLADGTIQAIAIEGRNDQSLPMAQAAMAADKHLWYDKPGGDDWAGYRGLIDEATRRGKQVQMGYMLRYHDAFRQVADWARAGFLGQVFSLRAHMTTNIPVSSPSRLNTRTEVSRHRGGILYDLGGHMLDQVVWMLGRPRQVTAFLHNDATPQLPNFADNALGVFEYDGAIAFVDIAAMGVRPTQRRIEVYGTEGTAILLEPFEPGGAIRLCLAAAKGGYAAGEQELRLGGPSRQELYERELASFVGVLRGEQAPDRTLDHELLVQETLLRATGGIPGG
jgi:predicted dehydrogenase